MKKKLLLIFCALFFFWFLSGYLAALYLTAPNHVHFTISDSTKIKTSEVSLKTEDKVFISASLLNGTSEKAVIILPGIKSNRLSSISRAELYLKKNYTVLIPDLRGTGKSSGNKITFGWDERKDLIACYHYLKNKGYKKIGAHGCSLGAATIAYSLQELNNYDFIVMESCYDNLENAFYNRVSKYPLPEFAFYPIHFFINKILSSDIHDLKPEEFIKLPQSPVLIMAGDSEFQLKLSETERLYRNCVSPRKSLHIFKGGKHEDFKIRFEEEYDEVLTNFINKLE
jgi:uncharacterized protein